MKLSNIEKEECKKNAKQVEDAFLDKSEALLNTYDDDIRQALKKLSGYSRTEIKETEIGKRASRYLSQAGNKPSDFFKKEMKHMKGWVPDYLLEDFYCSVDAVTKWQIDTSYFRRSMRTKDYSCYVNRVFRILQEYHNMGIYEADLVSIYQGNLKPELLATFRYHQSGFSSYEIKDVWIQAELDRGNECLLEILKDMILGENNSNHITYALIRGIVMSQCTRLYEALGQLLLAAKLQEGVRQAICENMDAGTFEAFRYLFAIVVEHDLLRFSSVLRSVGTWTGLLGDEEGKLDRISKKQIALIATYIEDEAARKQALDSEDSMAIYLALWSFGVFDIDEAMEVLEKTVLTGTRHQRLVCCYYLKAMHINSVYVHHVAKKIVSKYYNEQDTMAVIMSSFMPDYDTHMDKLSGRKAYFRDGDNYVPDFIRRYGDVKIYFTDKAECLLFYDILKDMLEHISKKQILFQPCIFPWNRESLDRSAIICRLAFCASALEDEDKITEIASLLPNIDVSSYNRSSIMCFLLSAPQNEKQRELLVGCVGDKEAYTSNLASQIVGHMTLTGSEYLQLEGMLKYKSSDIRSNVLMLLYKMEDKDLEACISRLLADKKEEKRTGGLDLLMQLQKDDARQPLFVKCRPYVNIIDNPTTKEAILIKEIQKDVQEELKEENGYDLYDVRAEYDPIFDASYLQDCKAAFDSIFSNQKKIKSLPGILKKLDDLIEEHKYDEFEDRMGNIRVLTDSYGGITGWYGELPCNELWTEFYNKEIKDFETCFLLQLYLDFLHVDEEHFVKFAKPFVKTLFGAFFNQSVELLWKSQVRRIINKLAEQNSDEVLKQKISVVVADSLLCGKKTFVYKWESKKVKDAQGKPKLLKRSILTYEPIKTLTVPLGMKKSQEYFDQIFPYQYELAFRHGFQLDGDLDESGYLRTYYGCMDFPRVEFYITACAKGIITKDFLYKKLFEKEKRNVTMEQLSRITQFYQERNRSLANRRKEYSWVDTKRKEAVEALLGHEVTDDFSKEDIKRLELAVKLFQDFSKLMIEAELTRGDSDTEFSANIYSVKRIYGVDNFVRILSAFGKETLERCTYFDSGWNRGQSVSKKQSLSHMLQVCIPSDGDSAENLAVLLKDTDIKESRLIEAAFYSPEWIPMIGEYLGWNGFESGCYYFMAHMNEDFDDKRKAMIARYTPIEINDLNDGAFDLEWFSEVYEQLGEQHFMLLYEAAKYISDGAKHTRARKYADAALGKYNETKVKKEITEKRNKDLVMAYGLIPIKEEGSIQKRYLFLQNFKKESKQFGAQRRASETRAVEISLQNLSRNAGYQDVTRLILKMESLEYEERKMYFEPYPLDELLVWLSVAEDGKCEVICEKNGKALKSIPAKYKKNEYMIALNENKKQLTEQYRRTKAMFEDAMEKGVEFTFGELKQLLQNPVTEKIVSNLVVKCRENLGFVTVDGLLSVEQGEKILPIDDTVLLSIAHPYHLYKAGCWHTYQAYLYEKCICQPFKQVFRELYVKTDEELNMYHSLRYAGHQIQPARTVGCLKSRHWVADVESGLQKVYYKENIVAQIYALADWFSPADIESPTLEWVVFIDRKTGKELKISAIPDIIFSEVMRDVDMAVSVAHAGGVDPEASHSTVEMRKAIAEFTIPLFKLKNVSFTKNHAVITGKLGNYTVHLGSGVIHQEGGPMINVLPVHSQRRGRIFLPFVDEDPKTAEILTKILFFAEDEKIKDPFILEQIV